MVIAFLAFAMPAECQDNDTNKHWATVVILFFQPFHWRRLNVYKQIDKPTYGDQANAS